MPFLDALTRALTDAATGYQRWQFGVRPALDAQALQAEELTYRRQQRGLQEEERKKAAAAARFNAMLAISRNDPQRAFQKFGDKFLQAARDATGVDFPTRERTVTEPGAILEPERVEQREGFTVMPKTAPSAMELFRAGERGQAFVPKVFPKTEEIRIPATRAPDVTKTVRELDIDEEPRRTLGSIIPGAPPEVANLTIEDAKALGFDIDNLIRSRREQEKLQRQSTIFQEALRRAGGNYNLAYRFASTEAPDLFPPRLEPEMHPLVAANIQSQIGTRREQLGIQRAHLGLRAQEVALRRREGPTGARLTPAQRDAIWQRSVNEASFQILGKRGSGLSFTVGPDGSMIPQMTAGQPPLTQDEINKIQARAEEIYVQRVARAFGQTRPAAPVAPAPSVPMTRGETERRAASRAIYRDPSAPSPDDALRREAQRRSADRGAAQQQRRPAPPGAVPMDPQAFAGQTVQAPNGKRYYSDGKSWYEVP